MSENTETAHRAVLEREAAKKARLEAKMEAAKENMEETLAAALRQENIRRAVAKEAKSAVDDPDRYRRIREKADLWGSRDRDVPTGYEDQPYVQVESYSSVDYN